MKPKTFFTLTLIIIAAVCTLLLAASPTALAQEPDYDRINNIAEKLNCPTCAGINLADCRTQTCSQWKEQISDLVAEGQTDQQVLDYFAARYGEHVLQEPPKSGITLYLWILPFIAILAGMLWLGNTLKNWARRQPAPVSTATPSPKLSSSSQNSRGAKDPYLEQVEKDLGVDGL